MLDGNKFPSRSLDCFIYHSEAAAFVRFMLALEWSLLSRNNRFATHCPILPRPDTGSPCPLRRPSKLLEGLIAGDIETTRFNPRKIEGKPSQVLMDVGSGYGSEEIGSDGSQ